jgi:HlyD family secretion protein
MAPEKSALDALRINRAPEKRPKPRYWLGVAILLLAAIGAAIFWWSTQRERVVEVRTHTVRETQSGEQRTLLNASGYVVARRQATVSAKVTGKISEVLVEEGMKVTAGQVLARLDMANVEASSRLAEAQLDAAKSALAETKVLSERAERDWKRMSHLAETDVASESELDRAQAEFNSLRARLEKQQSDIIVAEREIAVLRQQLEDMIIRAPFSGVITTKDAQPGEMVSPISAGGGFTRTGICTIVDMQSLEIEVDVNESFINRVKPDQPVEAVLDSYPNWKIPSKVIAIVPTADRQKATVKVRVGFEKLDQRILPQMGVKVAFQSAGESAEPAARSISVPKSAVRNENNRDVVWVVRGNRIQPRPVTVGTTSGDEVTIIDGLDAGEKVIIESSDELSTDINVKERS